MAKAGIAHLNDGSDDSVIDARIGMLLRIGMLASAAVIFAGGVVFLIRHGHMIVNYRSFRGAPPNLDNLTGIIAGAMRGHALAIIQLGLVMLIATPIARVAFSVYAFFSERDYLYVAIAGIVLAVLLLSLLWH
jgi:uncharacterized membrane protein